MRLVILNNFYFIGIGLKMKFYLSKNGFCSWYQIFHFNCIFSHYVEQRGQGWVLILLFKSCFSWAKRLKPLIGPWESMTTTLAPCMALKLRQLMQYLSKLHKNEKNTHFFSLFQGSDHFLGLITHTIIYGHPLGA